MKSGTIPRHKGAHMFALFGPLGLPELLIILFLIILIFGANRLPEIGRGIGRGIRNFKDATREDAQAQVRGSKDDR